jgi:pyridoxamine 5'-phosphate oxidase
MKKDTKDISHLRQDYGKDVLHKQDLSKDPFSQFLKWFEKALELGPLDANAMTLSTANAHGKPSARIVLLKAMEDGAFVFFTNYNSQKGKEMAENPQASLLFYWKELERQIKIEGLIEKVSSAQSTDYFQSRPKGSQISATASSQSEVVEDKIVLEERVAELEEKYKDADYLPRPENWGGYKLIPTNMEFWVGRPNRLHDRFLYTLKDGEWKIDRLSP